MVRHAVFELDGEVTQGAGPVGDGQGPLVADVFQAQVEQLEQRVHRGEQVSVAADLAKRAVERFDRVGGVDDPSDLWGEVEERRELVPMRLPTPADGWVPGVMGGAEGFQRGACGLLGGGAVDGLEVGGDGFTLLPVDILEAVAQLVDDAALDAALGVDRLKGRAKAA